MYQKISAMDPNACSFGLDKEPLSLTWRGHCPCSGLYDATEPCHLPLLVFKYHGDTQSVTHLTIKHCLSLPYAPLYHHAHLSIKFFVASPPAYFHSGERSLAYACSVRDERSRRPGATIALPGTASWHLINCETSLYRVWWSQSLEEFCRNTMTPW